MKLAYDKHTDLLASIPGLARGVYPYMGGAPRPEDLACAVRGCGHAAVSGVRGTSTARTVADSVIDPACYTRSDAAEPLDLFDGDVWLQRQRSADAPVTLTDAAQIPRGDRRELRGALARWRHAAPEAVVVLPIVAWWLREGQTVLVDEIRRAGRAVALVLVDPFNALDRRGTVAGLVSLLEQVRPLPVVLLRCDISAVGAVAHGAYAGVVGTSATRRHGPQPLNSRSDDPDFSPSVFVPALHDYRKASTLPAITRSREDDVLRCHDDHCQGRSLLRISRLAEVDLHQARTEAARHEQASTQHLARAVLSSSNPQDAWWEHCRAGADAAATLTTRGVTPSSWLGQWLALGLV